MYVRKTWYPYYMADLIAGSQCVYQGNGLEHKLGKLRPHTEYAFRLRTCTDGDDSPLSTPVVVTTEESGKNGRQFS